MIASARVVSFGHDPLLLQTRQRVLARCFHSSAVSSVDALLERLSSQPVDLLVLCHTISDEEYRMALEFAQSGCPSTDVLTLLSNRTTSRYRSKHTLQGAEGPAKLLEKVTEILRNQAQA